MKDYAPRPIDLDSSMLDFLQQAATKYDLPDIGKTVRCLVNFARENPDKLDDIFNEIRCLGC